jgi:TRAP transporter TAXI family solute receptor
MQKLLHNGPLSTPVSMSFWVRVNYLRKEYFMKTIKNITIGALVGTALSVMSLTSPIAQAASTFISIGTGGPTGVYFVVGNSICRMVHKEAAEGRKSGRKHGIRCAAPSTGGSNYNIGQIGEGELDFGVAQSDWQFHASNGSSKWEGKKQSDLRAVMSVHPEPFHIIVGKDSGINSWADLAGKRVNIGNPGSGQRGTMEVLMAAHGTKASDFKIATELTSSEQSKALCDGKIDAYGYTVGVPNAGVSIATDGCDARIINLNSDVEASLVNDNPYYAFATIPAGTYKTSSQDVTTFGVKATFVSSAKVSADVVYELVRAVFENIEDFRKLHPAFANLTHEQMISDGLSAPLHEGAVRYYKEQGWM